MLRLMRENTGSWIIKVILGLIVLVFVFLGMGSMGSKTGGQVALVNDVPISMDAFRRSHQNVIEQMRQRFGDNLNDDLLKLLQVEKMAMDRLIEDMLISQEADALELTVSDAELQASLVSIPAFQKDGKFDIETYRRVLSLNRLSPEAFEPSHRETLRQNRVRELVLKNIKVTDPEARAWYRDNETKVSLNYLFSDPDTFQELTPTADQIQAYYEKNKAIYQSKPRVTVQYLSFSVDDFKGKAAISKDQVEAYYLANKDEFFSPAKVDASHILFRVAEDADDAAVDAAKKQAREVYDKAVAGEDFAQLAKTYSQDMSKDNGGYLGSFEKDDMVKPFGDKAFSMAVNEISEPVKTMFGWHIIKVNGRTEASTRSMEDATPDIEKKLENVDLKSLAYTAASTAFDAVIDGDDLEQAGLIAGATVLEKGPFDATGPKEMGENAPAFASVALSLPVGEISDVKEVEDTFYIIKPIDRDEPEDLPLETVKDKVVMAVKKELQDKKAKEAAQAWLDDAGPGKDLKTLADLKSLPLKSTAFFGKKETIPELGQSPDIVEAAFQLKDNTVYPGVLKGHDGYYLIAMKEQQVPEEANVQENLDDVKKSLLSMKQNAAYADWITALKEKSTIEIEPGFLE
ncbi:peptidyl-prolyl cis-trans isomerase D [Desulfocicer vacuolatum DSM 3385]|uniref:Periplasmic chaperone PpiD n=1 Tax=Desulfocicer vacuolatum DSM 3385 TaxID=1121400 RepID=A0A1W2D9F0_9BACT|nr:peptidylprolyl isomerase [Desulfocicer vacuolatum]SMC94003.1 peptidyl-prolyl cis-trans isomerase D [Desulfocicer vacuolatum DSM 3385]